jgi:hypothetical protein
MIDRAFRAERDVAAALPFLAVDLALSDVTKAVTWGKAATESARSTIATGLGWVGQGRRGGAGAAGS